MAIEIDKIHVFRIIHYSNLEYILENGIYYRNSPHFDPNYRNIGSPEIINHRDSVPVKCYPDTTVNEYIPFYFGVRSPMLYKIKTGNGVPQIPQNEIIYLAFKMTEITESELQWCFTDGNAAKYITEFYNSTDDIDKLDWRSINATEWTDNNSDGDHDRMRKKHSEFLVKDNVPIKYLKGIIVLNENRKQQVENILQNHNPEIKVIVDNEFKCYYR
jgi:hypothetical protein